MFARARRPAGAPSMRPSGTTGQPTVVLYEKTTSPNWRLSMGPVLRARGAQPGRHACTNCLWYGLFLRAVRGTSGLIPPGLARCRFSGGMTSCAGALTKIFKPDGIHGTLHTRCRPRRIRRVKGIDTAPLCAKVGIFGPNLDQRHADTKIETAFDYARRWILGPVRIMGAPASLAKCVEDPRTGCHPGRNSIFLSRSDQPETGHP